MRRQLKIGFENASFCNVIGTSSAVEALRNALYKSTTTTNYYCTTTKSTEMTCMEEDGEDMEKLKGEKR